MAPPLRIAVLECDTPLDNINAKYEGYGGVFKELFRESAKRLGQPEKLDPETGFVISRWDIVDGDKYPNLDEVDALVLTGSSMLPSPIASIKALYADTWQSTTPSKTNLGS